MARAAIAAAILGASIAGLIAVLGWSAAGPTVPYRLDLDVYRIGAAEFLTGGDLYGNLPPTSDGTSLPFTYPPIAALLFVPFALVPYSLANIAHSLVSIGCLWIVVRIMLSAAMALAGRSLVLWTAGGFTVLLWLEPVGATLGMGQVNLVLMALVVVDLVAGRGRWWHGGLVGLAAAIKLTPLVFLAYFLFRRDWRSLAVAVGSFLGFTAVGFGVAREESVIYWTSAVLDPSRIGGLGYVSNQSINGMLVRLVPDELAGLLWFTSCVVLGLAVLGLLHQLILRGRDLEGILLLALFSLIASPVSWSHHWVYVVPMILVVAGWPAGCPGYWRPLLILSGLTIFYSRVLWILPSEHGLEQSWTWWQHLVGNAYLLWALLCIVGLWHSLPGLDTRPAYGTASGTPDGQAPTVRG